MLYMKSKLSLFFKLVFPLYLLNMDNIFHIAQTSLSQFLLSPLILRFCKRSQVQSPDPASSARPPQVSSASGVQQGGLTHWEEASPRFTKQSGWNSAPCMHFCQHQLRHSQWKASWTGKEIRAEGEGELGLISGKEQNGRFFPEARTSCDTSRGKTPRGPQHWRILTFSSGGKVWKSGPLRGNTADFQVGERTSSVAWILRVGGTGGDDIFEPLEGND